MKKTFAMLLAAILLLGVLAGCGGSTGGNEPAESVTVDLTAFYDGLSAEYEWVPEGMMDLAADEEMLEAFFPGLKDIPVKQLVLRTPMMSAVVNEIALVECENEADAAKVAEILRGRVTAQAEGGAWYPESMEAWGKAAVLTHGNYVAMIANGGAQSEIEAKFNALF
jgi:hypothetical protein